MENAEIKKIRETFKDVIESSIAWASVEKDLESAAIASFLISSPNNEASEDEMKIVLDWVKELAGKHSLLSLFLMGLMVVKVENGEILCSLVDKEKSSSCWGSTSSS
jgi:hypothetical protein